jgi:pimeloyl-ACP methyl ester carboxylesterase
MRRVAPIAALALAACPPAPASNPAQQSVRRLALSRCSLASGPSRVSALCGTLEVPEREGGLNTFDLFVAVVPAVSDEPEPDPLFFLAGGPGEAATQAFPKIAPAFDRINQTRDIVLVDQRGTGRSNPLACGMDGDLDPGPAEFEAELRRCLARIDADPRQFTTQRAIEDLERVRVSLGVERLDLYGASYGTRVAAEYLFEHPDRVRAAILDGVVPRDRVLGPGLAAEGSKAVDRILARCAADPPCAAAFPELETDLRRLDEQLETPVVVHTTHPRTGRPADVTLQKERARRVLALMSYASETAALLPLTVHLGANKELSPLATEVQLLGGEIERSISDGMALSVLCAEDAPFFPPPPTVEEEPEVRRLRQACAVWPRGEPGPEPKRALVSDAPILLLSGELDPVTPPANAAHVRETLAHAHSVVAPGQGHVVVTRGCIPAIAARFIAAPLDPTELRDGCAAQIVATPFFLDGAGPAP